MTQHFSLDELTIKSGVFGGLKGSPELTEAVRGRLKVLATRLEELRYYYRRPIYVTSGFRDTEHNRRVGGVPNSQHLLGNAADITAEDMNHLVDVVQTHWSWGWWRFYRENHFIHVDIRELEIGQEDADMESEVSPVRRCRFGITYGTY